MGKQNSKTERTYLDSYVLQQDYRIRMPKGIEGNMNIVPGKTYFDIFFDNKREEIILKISEKSTKGHDYVTKRK